MGDVAGVEQEGRLGGSAAMRASAACQGRGRIGIGGLVEADMGVADLDEAEPPPSAACRIAEQHGARHAAGDGPQHAGAGPGHAFQEAAAVDAVGRSPAVMMSQLSSPSA